MTPGGARSTQERLPLAAWLYIAGVAAAALAAVATWHVTRLGRTGLDRDPQWFWVAVLCGLAVLTWRVRERDIGGRVSLSLTSAIVLASVVLVGPEGAAVVGLAAPLAELGALPLAYTVLNCVMFSAIGAVAGCAYWVVDGPSLTLIEAHSPTTLAELVGAVVVADLVLCVVNAAILAGMYHVHRGRSFRRVLLGTLRSTGSLYVAYGVIGLIFVITWVPAGVGPISSVLVLAPLLVAQWSLRQYGEEQRSHERTLKALVTAMGTKDGFTRGHSERVAALCERMARELTLNEQESEALRYAGLLHDIGALGLPTRLLRRPAPLSDDEVVQVCTHAVLGVQMLAGIEFLRPSLDGVRHHHERWDGRGYPGQLAGADIPLFARVIAVADAFDALTTPRVRQADGSVQGALEELRRRAGSQFDPVMVDALVGALARTPWKPEESPPQRLGDPPYQHDAPAVSDAIAARPDLLHRIATAAGPRDVGGSARGMVA